MLCYVCVLGCVCMLRTYVVYVYVMYVLYVIVYARYGCKNVRYVCRFCLYDMTCLYKCTVRYVCKSRLRMYVCDAVSAHYKC